MERNRNFKERDCSARRESSWSLAAQGISAMWYAPSQPPLETQSVCEPHIMKILAVFFKICILPLNKCGMDRLINRQAAKVTTDFVFELAAHNHQQYRILLLVQQKRNEVLLISSSNYTEN